MAASYPSGFDSMSDPGANLSTNPHSTMHNQINDVIEAVEAELGLSPSGASATVTARFTADEALITKSYTVCTSGTRPSSPTEGDKIFETDTNKILVYSGAAWSSIGPVHGAFIDWTPVVTQSNTPTLTVNKATYQRVGRMAHAWWVVTVTSAGTAANPVTVSLPVAMAAGWISASAHLGAGTVYDASATLRYPGLVVPSGASTIVYFPSSFAAATTATLGTSDFTAALASGDIIGGYCTYETAADA